MHNTVVQRSPTFLAIDFFCGAGGTTRGLIDAGGYVVAGIDKDNCVDRTYRENNLNRTLDCSEPLFLEMDVFPQTKSYPEGQQEELKTELHKLIKAAKKKAPG